MAILPGTRIRDNGVFGTTLDAPLTAGAATFNSAELAGLSTVAGNHALVTLDPLKEFGLPEIVMVTAHTAAATVASITRGMFGTIARSHPFGTLWVHAACDNDFIEILTSGTRPADQYEGQSIYETDTDRYVGYTGAAWQQHGLFFDPPSCRAYNSVGGQSIPNTTPTPITLNSERWDTNSMHSTVTNTSRLTINTAGLYLITASLGYNAGGASAARVVSVYANGGATNIVEDQNVTAAGVVITVATVWKLAAGEYIEMYGWQASGGPLTILGVNALYPEFSATWIGRGN